VGLLKETHTRLDAVWNVAAGQLELKLDGMIMRAIDDRDILQAGSLIPKFKYA
jgi:hypothetical protein